MDVRRRAGDDVEHVAYGGLIFERLLQLVEEAGILDCDHSLVGKGSDQLDLFLSKRLRRGLGHKDHPGDIALAQERGAERSSVVADLLSPTPGILRVGQHIRHVNHPRLQRCSSGDAASLRPDVAGLEEVSEPRLHVARITVDGHQAE